jgi:hypothetical protein
MHDWADPYASEILTELRKVALPDTQLLVVDNIVAYACHDPTYDNNDSIPGAAAKDAPTPLLAKFGVANELSYSMDVMVSSSSHRYCTGCLLIWPPDVDLPQLPRACAQSSHQVI